VVTSVEVGGSTLVVVVVVGVGVGVEVCVGGRVVVGVEVRVAVVVSSGGGLASVVVRTGAGSVEVLATGRASTEPCACKPAGRASWVRVRVSAGWMSATTVAREAAVVVGIGGIRSSGIRGSRSTDPGALGSGGGLW
jgi:hypothetical protein